MPSLTLRNIPQQLYKQLKKEAKRQRRSLSQQAIHLLERGLYAYSRQQAERAIEYFQSIRPGAPDGLALELIREDRRR